MKTKLSLNNDFKEWVKQVKQNIRNAQIKAALRVNNELLRLYWELGGEITKRQKTTTWGNGLLEELSRELTNEFPDMKGFSHRNLRYIKQWYLFYNETDSIWQQVVAKLGEDVFFSVPWGHHLYIVSQCKDINKAIFFIRETVENGWSRAMLLNFLDTDLYERQGKAVSNFNRLLTEPQSDLAQQTLKVPYNFDFLTITKDFKELELEKALTQNITRFLLELGKGFAYVGRQIPLEVGNETIYPDLLFYHLELRCYCVVELKVKAFKPEYVGQLGTYVSAINHLKRKPSDNPTIGLLICKIKNKVMAQYALESSSQPIGISEYELRKIMPESVKSQLPSIEEIEQSLIEDEDKM